MSGKEINVEKLHNELTAAGLEISGVTSEGRIDWKFSPTAGMISQAEQIIASHLPVTEEEALRMAFRAKGLDVNTILFALWEKIMENNPASADQVLALMNSIKAEMSAGG